MFPQSSHRISPIDAERVTPFEVLIDRLAADRESAWIGCRRTLHTSPEPSGQEFATSQFILSRLDGPCITATIPERGVGVIADLRIGPVSEHTRTIAVRADIDGLRMTDQKSVPYASSKEGLAHACGHDAHTTIVLATAELLQTVALKSQESQLPPVHIRFLFQAAEETGEGARWMVEDGGLEGVSAILGLHVDPLIRAGRIGIRYGVLTAQVDEMFFTVEGRGGHAARPQHSTDPVAAAVMLISTLYQTVPRQSDALIPTVLTIGAIHAGTASNIIPNRVDIAGTLRTTDAEARLRLIGLIRSTCESVSRITGSTVSVRFSSPVGSVINDPLVTSAFEMTAARVLGEREIVNIDKPSMGGEDFAVYIEHVRGAQIRLGCAGEQEDWPLLHSPIFDVDERAIAIGARVMARTALVLAMLPRESGDHEST